VRTGPSRNRWKASGAARRPWSAPAPEFPLPNYFLNISANRLVWVRARVFLERNSAYNRRGPSSSDSLLLFAISEFIANEFLYPSTELKEVSMIRQ